MKYFDTLGDGTGCVEQQLGDVIILEMQDSMLPIPKIISFASKNYDSSESFVRP